MGLDHQLRFLPGMIVPKFNTRVQLVSGETGWTNFYIEYTRSFGSALTAELGFSVLQGGVV